MKKEKKKVLKYKFKKTKMFRYGMMLVYNKVVCNTRNPHQEIKEFLFKWVIQ